MRYPCLSGEGPPRSGGGGVAFTSHGKSVRSPDERAARYLGTPRRATPLPGRPTVAPALEHFPEKWTPVFRRKCDKIKNLERFAIQLNRRRRIKRSRRMNENHGASPFQLLEQGLEPSVAQIDAVCVRRQDHAVQLQDIIGIGQLGERARGPHPVAATRRSRQTGPAAAGSGLQRVRCSVAPADARAHRLRHEPSAWRSR
jgi:hypothetical protein